MRLFLFNKERDDADDDGGQVDHRQMNVLLIPVPDDHLHEDEDDEDDDRDDEEILENIVFQSHHWQDSPIAGVREGDQPVKTGCCDVKHMKAGACLSNGM